MKSQFNRKPSGTMPTSVIGTEHPEIEHQKDIIRIDNTPATPLFQSNVFDRFANSSFFIIMTAVLTFTIMIMCFTSFLVVHALHLFFIPAIIIFFILGRYRPYYYVLSFFYLILWFNFSITTVYYG